jgi:hypothetical protein
MDEAGRMPSEQADREATVGPPAPGGVGLLIIDMINDMDFAGAGELKDRADDVAEAILRLRDEADAAAVPVVYVNDNYGQWHSERSRIIDYCRDANATSRRIVERLAPRPDDYFVIKPQFSGFYATNLPVLLPPPRRQPAGADRDRRRHLRAVHGGRRPHARLRALDPCDAVASTKAEHAEWALQIMAKSMDAEIRSTRDLRLSAWIGAPPDH